MEQRSMTALISMFARWYHATYNDVKVFDDTCAGSFLSEAEKKAIAENMRKGIGFFNPTFQGSEDDALRWIVDNQLSPTPLGRAAFCEEHLQRAVRIGAKQYLILGAGYDSFAYRQPAWASGLHIFEIDHPATARDKMDRLVTASIRAPKNTLYVCGDFNDDLWHEALSGQQKFSRQAVSFCSMLGISYYLAKDRFEQLIQALSTIIPHGSSVVFDYPDQDSYTEKAGERAKKQAMLASGAKEAMLASYSYPETESMLSKYGFLIYEHLTPEIITKQYFDRYNTMNPTHAISAFDNVNYCLAVKQ